MSGWSVGVRVTFPRPVPVIDRSNKLKLDRCSGTPVYRHFSRLSYEHRPKSRACLKSSQVEAADDEPVENPAHIESLPALQRSTVEIVRSGYACNLFGDAFVNPNSPQLHLGFCSVRSYYKGGRNEKEKHAVGPANRGDLQLGSCYFLLGDDTFEDTARNYLIIVFSKLPRLPVDRSIG